MEDNSEDFSDGLDEFEESNEDRQAKKLGNINNYKR